MRKSKTETAETRKRILQTAATEFRGKGLHGVGLSDVMAAAGLTHGGFYRHFESKDQLVTEVMAMDTTAERAAARAQIEAAEDGLKAIVKTYLSPAHRDNTTRGCYFAALGSELVRTDEDTREAATQRFLKNVDLIAAQYKKLSPAAARRKALTTLCSMVGALTMSRIVTDPELSATILKEAEKQLTEG